MTEEPRSARVVLASHNPGKLRELRRILRSRIEGLDVDREVVDAGTAGIGEIPETGIGFEENSLLKARAVAEQTGLIALADDSGLCVDVLGGAPGFLSARWSGRHGDDRANLELLLAQLADVPEPHRGARFACAASLVTPRGEQEACLGSMPGRLAFAPSGEGGFGYDPIFLPEELPEPWAGRSAAEIPAELKNQISHRGRAFTALVPHLRRVLAQQAGGRG